MLWSQVWVHSGQLPCSFEFYEHWDGLLLPKSQMSPPWGLPFLAGGGFLIFGGPLPSIRCLSGRWPHLDGTGTHEAVRLCLGKAEGRRGGGSILLQVLHYTHIKARLPLTLCSAGRCTLIDWLSSPHTLHNTSFFSCNGFYCMPHELLSLRTLYLMYD